MDSILAEAVFETNVTNLPVLKAFFQEYEESQKLFRKDLNMTDYDTSCNDFYEDSKAASTQFRKQFYESREYQYKVSKTCVQFSRSSYVREFWYFG